MFKTMEELLDKYPEFVYPTEPINKSLVVDNVTDGKLDVYKSRSTGMHLQVGVPAIMGDTDTPWTYLPSENWSVKITGTSLGKPVTNTYRSEDLTISIYDNSNINSIGNIPISSYDAGPFVAEVTWHYPGDSSKDIVMSTEQDNLEFHNLPTYADLGDINKTKLVVSPEVMYNDRPESLKLTLNLYTDISDPFFIMGDRVAVASSDGTLDLEPLSRVTNEDGTIVLEYAIENLPVTDGKYPLTVALKETDESEQITIKEIELDIATLRTIEDDVNEGSFDVAKSNIHVDNKEVIVGKSFEASVSLFSLNFPDKPLKGVTEVKLVPSNANAKVESVSNENGEYLFRVTGIKEGGFDLTLSVKGNDGQVLKGLSVLPVPRTIEDDVIEGAFSQDDSYLTGDDSVVEGNKAEVSVLLFSKNFKGEALVGVTDVTLIVDDKISFEATKQSNGRYFFNVTGLKLGLSNIKYSVKGVEGKTPMTITVEPTPRTIEDDIREGSFDTSKSYITSTEPTVKIGRSVEVTVLLFSKTFPEQALSGVKDVTITTDALVDSKFVSESDGVYVFELTSKSVGTSKVGFKVKGNDGPNTTDVDVIPMDITDIDVGKSDLTIAPNSFEINKPEDLVVTYVPRDEFSKIIILPEESFAVQLGGDASNVTVSSNSVSADGKHSIGFQPTEVIVSGSYKVSITDNEDKVVSKEVGVTVTDTPDPKTLEDIDAGRTTVSMTPNTYEVNEPVSLEIVINPVADNGDLLVPEEDEFRLSFDKGDEFIRIDEVLVDDDGTTLLSFSLVGEVPSGTGTISVVAQTANKIVGQPQQITITNSLPMEELTPAIPRKTIADISASVTVVTADVSKFDLVLDNQFTITITPKATDGELLTAELSEFYPTINDSSDLVTIIGTPSIVDGVYSMTVAPTEQETGDVSLRVFAKTANIAVGKKLPLLLTKTIPWTPLEPSKPHYVDPTLPSKNDTSDKTLDPPKKETPSVGMGGQGDDISSWKQREGDLSNDDFLAMLVEARTAHRANPAESTYADMVNQMFPTKEEEE